MACLRLYCSFVRVHDGRRLGAEGHGQGSASHFPRMIVHSLVNTWQCPKFCCCCCFISRKSCFILLTTVDFALPSICFTIAINIMAFPLLHTFWNRICAPEICTMIILLCPIPEAEQGIVPSTSPTEKYRSQEDSSSETLVRDFVARGK